MVRSGSELDAPEAPQPVAIHAAAASAAAPAGPQSRRVFCLNLDLASIFWGLTGRRCMKVAVNATNGCRSVWSPGTRRSAARRTPRSTLCRGRTAATELLLPCAAALFGRDRVSDALVLGAQSAFAPCAADRVCGAAGRARHNGQRETGRRALDPLWPPSKHQRPAPPLELA